MKREAPLATSHQTLLHQTRGDGVRLGAGTGLAAVRDERERHVLVGRGANELVRRSERDARAVGAGRRVGREVERVRRALAVDLVHRDGVAVDQEQVLARDGAVVGHPDPALGVLTVLDQVDE